MASGETKTTESIAEEIKELRKTVDTIRHNELVHVEERLSNLEGKMRAPLSTAYLIVAFAVFIGILAAFNLPPLIGRSVAGVSGAVAGLGLFYIFRTVKKRPGE